MAEAERVLEHTRGGCWLDAGVGAGNKRDVGPRGAMGDVVSKAGPGTAGLAPNAGCAEDLEAGLAQGAVSAERLEQVPDSHP